MEAWAVSGPKSACDDARLYASLAVDGALDDVGLAQLRSHLAVCPACASLVAEMRAVVALVRRAPQEPYRCEPPGARLLRSCSSNRPHWAGAAVAVIALVLATASLPGAADPTSRLDSRAGSESSPRLVVPFKLPIGQRSAVDDFVVAAPDRFGSDRTR
jgi:anti-sigma factor RsiW